MVERRDKFLELFPSVPPLADKECRCLVNYGNCVLGTIFQKYHLRFRRVHSNFYPTLSDKIAQRLIRDRHTCVSWA